MHAYILFERKKKRNNHNHFEINQRSRFDISDRNLCKVLSVFPFFFSLYACSILFVIKIFDDTLINIMCIRARLNREGIIYRLSLISFSRGNTYCVKRCVHQISPVHRLNLRIVVSSENFHWNFVKTISRNSSNFWRN